VDKTANPALPIVAVPVVIEMRPPVPDVVDPVENFIPPLIPPELPAFEVLRRTEPEDFGLLTPAERDNEPPVAPPESPALKIKLSPLSTVPVPALTIMFPLCPVVADPETILTAPLPPELVVPDSNRRVPETPASPASTDRIIN
jgi:hypothetical protein